MIVLEIRLPGDGGEPLTLHRQVTVLTGLDTPAERAQVRMQLSRALSGDPGVAVEIELEGRRQPLTPEVARRLGLGASGALMTVGPADLPGAVVASPPRPASEAAPGSAFTSADPRGVDDGEGEAQEVAEAEERVRVAAADLEAARLALSEAEAPPPAPVEAAAETGTATGGLDCLVAEQTELESEHAKLASQLADIRFQSDPGPVEAALVELRRLRAVKSKPSAAAARLADRWVAASKAVADLAPGPEPPEWLAIPARAALTEARQALERAEAGGGAGAADPELVEALERAHREVLDAQQKMMRKGTRLNRRRVDQAHEAEQEALLALGVTSYGEYLQRYPPALTGSPEGAVAAARAAVADAEAVWEELHVGLRSAEWVATTREQDAARQEAHGLLGRFVPDDELEEALRAHHEAIVETGWAEQALEDALSEVTAVVPDAPDLEVAAERWLSEAPARVAQREELERALSALEERLRAVADEVAELQSDAFFGSGGIALVEPAGVAPGELPVDGRTGDDPVAVAALRAAVLRAEEAEQQAEATLAAAHQRAKAGPGAGEGGGTAEVDLAGVTSLEAELYLLARLVSLRSGRKAGPLPVVLDAAVVGGLAPAAGSRVLGLIERAAGHTQVVVVGDDEPVAGWAKQRGGGAALRRVALTTEQSRRWK